MNDAEDSFPQPPQLPSRPRFFILSPNARKVMMALRNPKYELRTLTGAAVEAGLNEQEFMKALMECSQEGLAGAVIIPDSNKTMFAPSAAGKIAII